jgi:endonuclease/exonuclease/phosphatase family metal-dependent hydrolase
MSDSIYLRFTETSADIRNLESNTPYYFKVRVITEDGTTSLSDYSDAVSATTSVAPVLSPIQNPLKVSSYNVHCGNCSTDISKLWHTRRDTVVAQIKDEKPDVIGLQEASQGWLYDASGKQINLAQFEDLQSRLVAAGVNYQLTNASRNNCENSFTPTDCVWKDQGASQGTKIIYNADTVEMVDQGSERLAYISDADNQRYVAWGIFRQKSSGKTFFFADTHIEPSSHTPEYLDLKIRQAQRIADLIKEKNTANLPVFIVGDMNSNKYMEPANGPYDVFTKSGYVDPLGNDYGSTYPSGKATAEKRVNAEYNSFNGFTAKLNKNDNPGANGKHLDYIFTSPMRVAEWEMSLNKDASDNLVGIIPSDHNMIVGTVELPASQSPLAAKTVQLNGSLGAVTGSEVYTKTGAYQRYENGYVLWSPKTGANVSSGAIRGAFAALGYEDGILGYPTADEVTGQSNGGSYQMYENGAIDWSPTTGAHATYGEIRAKWKTTGYVNGSLGYPTGDVTKSLDGASQLFQNGAIIWSPTTGAFVTSLEIHAAWVRTNAEAAVLGFPTGDLVKTATGAYQRFQNGYVDWTPTTGAHATYGPIRSRWLAAGGSAGVLGNPTSDVVNGQLNGGSYQMYEHGAIDWSPTTGAYATYGEIRGRWAATGYSAGVLGYPTGNVVTDSNGMSYQRFQNGYIIHSAATGAHVSMGPIRTRWAATGYETGYLGFPTGEIVTSATGSYQRYEKGYILYSPATGAYSSMGPIRSVYASLGYEGGRLGYPTSEVKTTSTGITQDYAGGTISISTAGVKTVTYK